MTENPYAITLDDLVDSARVPVAEQVVEQPQRLIGHAGGGTTDLGAGGCDADGE